MKKTAVLLFLIASSAAVAQILKGNFPYTKWRIETREGITYEYYEICRGFVGCLWERMTVETRTGCSFIPFGQAETADFRKRENSIGCTRRTFEDLYPELTVTGWCYAPVCRLSTTPLIGDYRACDLMVYRDGSVPRAGLVITHCPKACNCLRQY